MRMRWMCGALLLCVAAAAPVRAQEQKSAAPMVVVRVRSLDAVVENVKLVASMVGKENIAQQIQGIIRTKIGPQGLQGIDTARPFGVYGRLGNDLNDIAGVVMIPVKDEKSLLGLLENLNLNATKDNDGIYSVQVAIVNVFFRFHKGYAYVTALNRSAISDGQVLDPARVFPAGQTAALSATLRFDQIPEVAKKIALSKIEEDIGDLARKRPNESALEHAVRVEAQKEALRRIKLLFDHAQELTADIDLDAKAKAVKATFVLTARPDSELAREIADVGKLPSVFGGVKGKAAVDGRIHVVVPASVAKAFADGLKDEIAKGIGAIDDEGKRKQAEALAESLLDSVRRGEIDALVQLNAKDKHYNLVAGIKLQDGAKVGKLVEDLAKDLLQLAPPAERDKVKFNAESAGGVNIHRVDAQSAYDANARELFGDNPFYIAFRQDALLLSVGEGGLEALKSVLTAPAGPGPALRIDISLAQLAPLIGKNDEKLAALGKKLGDDGRVRLTVEGGNSLRGELSAQLSVVRYFGSIFLARGKFKPVD
jgi:hypothetical protein